MDLQTIRRERRRLHQPRRTVRNRGGGARADGAARPPGRGRPQGPRTDRSSLPEAGPEPGRRHHYRGVHGIVPQRRCDHQVPADVRRGAVMIERLVLVRGTCHRRGCAG
jgi:hypothetical protein